MKKCSLAVDIGASSGRIVVGFVEDGLIKKEEIYRFENHLIEKDGYICWDIDKLYEEIKTGLRMAGESDYSPSTIGVDTWAVDFILLDENDEPLTPTVSYRDPRTDGIMEEVLDIVGKEKLYLETGIQFQKFNTIYQLYYLKKKYPEVLEKAKSFLMIPDYINFLLTGVKTNEYTNATTTQLVNAFSKNWDESLLRELGLDRNIFQDILPPKSTVGSLRDEHVKDFGFDAEVVLPATHDTASAVVSMASGEDSIYISSGTWSLIGVENSFPISVDIARKYNFTNEGGLDYRFRFLKNIMGLWMVQEVKRNYKDKYTHSELVELAKKENDFKSIVEVDNDRFLRPVNMVEEIKDYCVETGQQIPETPGQIAKCIFESLVVSYCTAISQIEEIYEKRFKRINIFGGGSKNDYLNSLIAEATGKEVFAGPVEATAIGNIASQLISIKEIDGIHEAREMIKNSFDIKQIGQIFISEG